MVSPCRSLSAASRPRSENSWWEKFDSANHRSTRAGTLPAAVAARSAASSVSAWAARRSKTARDGASRVLTTMTVGRACWTTASGRAPKRPLSGGSARAPGPAGRAVAPMTTRPARSASSMIVGATLLPSTSDGFARPCVCRRTKAASARSVWERTTGSMPGGTTWRASTSAPRPRPRASAKRSASSACGPPRTGTRIRRMSLTPRCLTTAMSQGASRTTSSMVGLKTASTVLVRAPFRPGAGAGRPSRRG